MYASICSGTALAVAVIRFDGGAKVIGVWGWVVWGFGWGSWGGVCLVLCLRVGCLEVEVEIEGLAMGFCCISARL